MVSGTEGDGMPGYSERKDDHLKRLRRIEGQVRGLQRMVEEDKYCIDILTQVSAMTKALQSFALEPARRAPRATACVDAAAPRRQGGRREGPRGVRGDRPAGPVLTASRAPGRQG